MNVMMTLGGFQFGISTAAYQELRRKTEYRWPAQERFMQGEALQYVGPGADTITLPGVIYPGFRGGTGQLDAMRALAAQGTPHMLITGAGSVLGEWVVERIEEGQSVFAAAGAPRKQEFTMSLRKYAGPASVGGALAQLLTSADLPSPLASSPLASLGSLNIAVASQAGGFASSLSSAYDQVTAVGSQIGSAVNGVLSPISRAVDVASTLKAAAQDSKRLLGSIPTSLSGIASATSLVNAASLAVNNAGAAGALLKRSVADLSAQGAVPASAIAAAKGALVTVNNLTVAATRTQTEASTLLGRLRG